MVYAMVLGLLLMRIHRKDIFSRNFMCFHVLDILVKIHKFEFMKKIYAICMAFFVYDAIYAIDRINLDSLVSEWRNYTIAMDFDKVIRSGIEIFEEASASGDNYARMYSCLFIAQTYVSKTQYDSVYYWMSLAENDVEMSQDPQMKMMLYNIKAIMSLSLEVDYAACFDYLNKALDIARKSGSKENERCILCNIANIYSIRKDTSGFVYARQAYEQSRRDGDMHTLPSAIVYMIRMSILKGEYEEAMAYTKELDSLYAQVQVAQYGYMVNLLTADIMAHKGDSAAAEQYYVRAFDLSDSVTYPTMVNGCLEYGMFLLERKRLDDAENILGYGLSVSREKNLFESMGRFLLGLSEVYERMGEKEKAYEYYQQYHIFERQNSINERKFNQLLMMYQALKHEKEIGIKDLELLKTQKRYLLVGTFSFVLVMILVCMYVLYKRKNRMYRKLVENHYKLSLALEKALEDRSNGELTEKQMKDLRNSDDALFCKMESLMKDDRLYRRKDISLEMVSDILDTNRTYISSTINVKSGKSFCNYVNGYRISEAISILSDIHNDIPLKALCEDLGFNSMSAFYRSFQKETGVPPSCYREQMRRIKTS